MQLKKLITHVFLLSAIAGQAQTNQYAEFQRSISNAKSNAAYIEAIENSARTPNAKYQPSAIDRKAVQELTDTWKTNPANGVGLRRWSESDLATIKTQEARNTAEAAAEKRRNDGRVAVYLPIYKELMADGLSNNDASRIVDLGINKDASVSVGFPYLYLMSNYYRTFREKSATASFTDLLTLVLQYEILFDASYNSLQTLEKRFPDQQYIIDMTYLKILPRYFSGMFTNGNYTPAYASLDNDKGRAERAAVFFKLAQKYPEASANFLTLCDDLYNPYVLRIKAFSKEKKYKEAKELILQYLYMPNEKFMAALAATSGKYILRDLDVQGYQKLATLQKVQPLDLVFGTSYSTCDYRFWDNYWISGRGKYTDEIRYDKRLSELIKEFAEAGNADAQNIYAVRIGLGFEKAKEKDALEWFQKSLAGGNKDAVENLKTICSKNIKGIENYCKK